MLLLVGLLVLTSMIQAAGMLVYYLSVELLYIKVCVLIYLTPVYHINLVNSYFMHSFKECVECKCGETTRVCNLLCRVLDFHLILYLCTLLYTNSLFLPLVCYSITVNQNSCFTIYNGTTAGKALPYKFTCALINYNTLTILLANKNRSVHKS